MSNRIPADRDFALSFWARLTIIEQFSLAIVERAFPQAGQARGTRRRNALLAAEVRPSLAATSAEREADESGRSAPVAKVPVE